MKIEVLTLTLVVLLVLGSGIALAGSVRCTTYEGKSLGRLQTLCDDGTRAVHTWNKPLARSEGIVTPPQDLHRADKPQDPPVGGALSMNFRGAVEDPPYDHLPHRIVWWCH